MTEERMYPVEEPQPVPAPEAEKPEEEEEEEDISDLFEIPKQGYEKEDISDLTDFTEEDEEELVGVSEEDVMGEEEKTEEEPEEEPEAEKPHWSDEDIKRYEESQRPQVVRKPLYRRTTKPVTPPDQISGTR